MLPKPIILGIYSITCNDFYANESQGNLPIMHMGITYSPLRYNHLLAGKQFLFHSGEKVNKIASGQDMIKNTVSSDTE